MTHDAVECASFWDYVDGELSETQRGAYLRHVASCPACRTNLEEYSLVAQCLGWSGEEEPPEDLRATLLEEFRREHPEPDGGKRVVSWTSTLGRSLRVPVWGAAVILMGALALFYAVRSGEKTRESTGSGTVPLTEYVAYQVYGPDGSLKADVRTTIQKRSGQ